jgi:hypothetical protein
MAKFKMAPLVGTEPFTARLGSASGSVNYLTNLEIGKAVKQIADSQYNLCSAGDPIEGFICAVEGYTADDFSIGSVQDEGRVRVTLDGLQATPGTGVIAVGNYVVCGTVVAKGVGLSGAYPKVCKATNQPGTAVVSVVGAADTAAAIKTRVDEALAKVAEAQKNGLFAWRVVSLDGTTAVGQTAVIERVCA